MKLTKSNLQLLLMLLEQYRNDKGFTYSNEWTADSETISNALYMIQNDIEQATN